MFLLLENIIRSFTTVQTTLYFMPEQLQRLLEKIIMVNLAFISNGSFTELVVATTNAIKVLLKVNMIY